MIPPDTYDSYPEDVCVLKDGPDFQEDLQPTRVNIVCDKQVITVLQSALTMQYKSAS
jgi:hypothetical protein